MTSDTTRILRWEAITALGYRRSQPLPDSKPALRALVAAELLKPTMYRVGFYTKHTRAYVDVSKAPDPTDVESVALYIQSLYPLDVAWFEPLNVEGERVSLHWLN